MNNKIIVAACALFIMLLAPSVMADCVSLTNGTSPAYISLDTTLCTGYYNINVTNELTENGAIWINANGITLDCNGSTIFGNGTGYGIFINESFNNVVIQNCTVTLYEEGVYTRGTYQNLFMYVNATANTNNGFRLNATNSTEIFYSNATLNGDNGFSLDRDNFQNIILYSDAQSNGANGVYIESSDRNQFLYSNSAHNTLAGLYIFSDSDENIIDLNTITDNNNGVYLFDSSNYNNITNNIIYSQLLGSGIANLWNVGTYTSSNLIYSNLANGIYNLNSIQTTNYNDSIYDHAGYGVYDDTCTNTIIDTANITDNANGGIFAYNFNNTTTKNSHVYLNWWIGIDYEDSLLGNQEAYIIDNIVDNNTVGGIWTETSDLVYIDRNNITGSIVALKPFFGFNTAFGIASVNTSGTIRNNSVFENDQIAVPIPSMTVGIYIQRDSKNPATISGNTVGGQSTIGVDYGYIYNGNIQTNSTNNVGSENEINVLHSNGLQQNSVFSGTFTDIFGTYGVAAYIEPLLPIPADMAGATGADGVAYFDSTINSFGSDIYLNDDSSLGVANTTYTNVDVLIADVNSWFGNYVYSVVRVVDGNNSFVVVPGATVNSYLTGFEGIPEWAGYTNALGRSISNYSIWTNNSLVPYPVDINYIELLPGGMAAVANWSDHNFTATLTGYTTNPTCTGWTRNYTTDNEINTYDVCIMGLAPIGPTSPVTEKTIGLSVVTMLSVGLIICVAAFLLLFLISGMALDEKAIMAFISVFIMGSIMVYVLMIMLQ